MRKTSRPVTIDFETFGIEGRPDYPPEPVSVAIKYPGKPAKFFAWGHASENNCKKSDALAALKIAWKWDGGLLFQNGKFDLDVADTYLKLPIPAWDKIHDTMFLLFLHDPHQAELGLKPSSERILGMKPDEQDAVGDWLVEHQPIAGVKISKAKSSEHYFGRYIAYAPGSLVGKYCIGDVVRTEKLFNFLMPDIIKRGMLPAYNRERELMPFLLDIERQGLPIDVKRLKADCKSYADTLDKIDTWVYKRLGVVINISSGKQLVNAMVAAGCADPDKIPRTPKTGEYQSNKVALLTGVTDLVLLGMLKYRTQLNTCLNTFMLPWLETAIKSGGLIFTTWNQVKNPKGDDTVGTRTGRLSSTPNFQNIPKEFLPIFKQDALAIGDKELAKTLAKCPFELPPLPKVRSYVKPFKGEMMIVRDYSQQELRILAHFDGGALLTQYQNDPWMDMHDYAREELLKKGLSFNRRRVKNTNFGLIYGMGYGKLAEKNDQTVLEAKVLKKAVLLLYPGLKEMNKDMKMRSRNHIPIMTWGGREYYCEEPRIIDGHLKEFDYKMINVLIQGSAADCTKEAMIRFFRKIVELKKQKVWRVLLTVHDELVISVPKSQYKEAMRVLQQVMEGIEFDVQMLSEGFVSNENWASLKPYDKKGKLAA